MAAVPTPIDPGNIIYLKDWLTLAALLLGPLIAVLITLWRQSRDHAYAAKERLFLTLMAHRKLPPTLESIAALNLIDVVYADHPNILTNWGTLYDLAVQQQAAGQKWNHEFLLMLQNMAVVLGYKRLKVTDIDRFYFPTNLGQGVEGQAKIAEEWLRILKASKSFASDAEPESGPDQPSL